MVQMKNLTITIRIETLVAAINKEKYLKTAAGRRFIKFKLSL
jgi:hypothetical protein